MDGKIKRLERNMGSTIEEIVRDVDSHTVLKDLSRYEPIRTGFDKFDNYIGGGLKRSELILVGGPPGVGKTIASLQIARNIAKTQNKYVYYISYEHSQIHLVHRLLCMESMLLVGDDGLLANGVDLRYIDDMFAADHLGKFVTQSEESVFTRVLRSDSKTRHALQVMQTYEKKLILRKGGAATDLDTIRQTVDFLHKRHNGQLVVIVDYLQKVPVAGNPTEQERVTIVVEGLKNIALDFDIPVWSVVAADRQGLQAERMHLYHLRGSSALEYEADIAIIMSNKYTIMRKDLIHFLEAKEARNWVVFTIEKNRAGTAFQEIEFQLHGRYFGFNPTGKISKPTELIDSRGSETIIRN